MNSAVRCRKAPGFDGVGATAVVGRAVGAAVGVDAGIVVVGAAVKLRSGDWVGAVVPFGPEPSEPEPVELAFTSLQSD